MVRGGSLWVTSFYYLGEIMENCVVLVAFAVAIINALTTSNFGEERVYLSCRL